MRPRALMIALAAIFIAGGAAVLARPFVTGLSFVVRAANIPGAVRRIAAIGVRRPSERSVRIPAGGDRTLAARLYLPTGTTRRATLLVSGLHPAGINEPRLVDLARNLAADGIAVVTPAIPELEAFAITTRITDDIEASALWLARQPGLVARDGRVGLIGISFSGGLALVAAGRSTLADRLAFVVSVGGHDDLPRVLRYLCTGSEASPRPVGGAPQPFVRPPHDYGVAIILLGVAEKLVPASQVAPLRAAVRRFLDASALDGVDKEAAAREFAALRTVARTLPEPSATLLRYVNDRDVVHLGARLLPVVGLYGAAPALSVSRSPKTTAPVFLLHGTDDNVIPTVEAEYLADDLRGHASVRLLLSTLISHVGADREPHVTDIVRLADFWGDVLTR